MVYSASDQMGTEDLPPGLKQQRRETRRSPPFNAGVKNARSYTSALPYIFKARCLNKKVMIPSKLVEWQWLKYRSTVFGSILG
jgi:hypothetical protein